MKKLLAITLALAMIFALCACGQSAKAKDTYTVGICQLVQHPALDAATQGFKDVLTEAFGDKVKFEEGNASGDSATCATICTGFVSNKVDLIMANATPALQAAAAATAEIPVLGTSVTEYGVALSIENFNGTVGGNISGTSDLAPLDEQANMLLEIFPDAKNVGIIYCSAEANSKYQVNVVKAALEAKGVNVTEYAFADSNDLTPVATTACDSSDVIYVPTDNTVASCTEALDAVAKAAGVPVVAGEEGICAGCGIVTLSIDYYNLGRTTGEMAVKILKGETKIAEMPVEYFQNPVKKYNAANAALYNITLPAEYVAIG